VLRQAGATVETAANVAAARLAIQHSPFNVVLSDLAMPEEDGYALVRWVRQWIAQTERPLPVIALTAFATVEERARALSAGFAGFVTKPVEADELIDTLHSLLRS
jgi:CheY-like chemotaxis protein